MAARLVVDLKFPSGIAKYCNRFGENNRFGESLLTSPSRSNTTCPLNLHPPAVIEHWQATTIARHGIR